jgi:uncharacterized protein with beta-barrel porin domain
MGRTGHRDGDSFQGSARLNSSNTGGAAGIDLCVGSNLIIGIAFGGAHTDFSLDGRAQNGTASSGFAGSYGSWASGPLYINLGLSYGRNEYNTTRNVAINTLNEIATGSFAGNQFASRLEAGLHLHFSGYGITPFFGLSGQVLRQNGYSENAVNTTTGQPGITGLNTQGQTSTAPLPYLGGEASTTYNFGEHVTFTPRLRLSWGRETSMDRQSTSSFQSLPGATFTVNGAAPARNTANVRAGFDADLFGLLEAYAQVDSALASGGNGFAAAAGIRMAW